ncbi:MAG: hypothetical protein WD770_01205 [Actinomycetota bacterium]
MLERLDASRLANGLLYLGPGLLLPGLFGLKDHLPWGIAILVLAVATTGAALLVARADPAGRSIDDVLSGDGDDTTGGVIGGSLFAGFIVGTISFAAAGEVAPYIVLGLYVALVVTFVLYARAGARGPRERPARAAPAGPQPTGAGQQILDALRSANVISVGESGVQMMSGAELGDRLMGQTALCLRCGTSIRFQEGGLLAMDRGIRDKVVMCGNCHAIFEINLSPSGMQLTADVTSRFERAAEEPPAPSAEATPDAEPAGPSPDVTTITDIDELIRLAIGDPDAGRRMAALEKFISGTEPVEVMALSRICVMAFDPAVRARAVERLRERGNEARARFIIQGELNETNPSERWFGELTDEQRSRAHQSLLELGP